MGHKQLIASDLDRTFSAENKLAGDQFVLHNLQRSRRRSKRRSVALVYTSRLSFDATWKLVDSGLLPEPDAIASSQGTEIWFPTWDREDPFFREFLKPYWNRDAVAYFARKVPGLKLLDTQFQTPFKVSFLVKNSSKIYDFKRLLAAEGLQTKAVYSYGKYLDILPLCGGKFNALKYVARVWNVPLAKIQTCDYGDSHPTL